MTELTIGNLVGISEPAAKLIDKVSDAIGVCFLPYQTLRMADAEAKAALIRAQADLDVSLLQQRAAQRFIQEEVRQQKHIEAITTKALPYLNATASPETIEDDWMVNFFDKCRLTSDQDMQLLWAKVLAGKANHKGNFSRKTVNLLSDLEKEDAELFQEVARYAWDFDENNNMLMLLNCHDSIYTRNEVHYSSLLHLEHLGLISFAAFRDSKLSREIESRPAQISYFGEHIQLQSTKTGRLFVPGGVAQFTNAGEELSKICGVTPVEGFFNYIYQHLAAEGLIPGEEPKKEQPKQRKLFSSTFRFLPSFSFFKI